MPAPQLTPGQLDAAQRVADDAGRVADAFPPAEVWQREFPDAYTETPDGKYDVAYIHPGMTQEEKERNCRKKQALIQEWVKVGQEASLRQSAEVPTIKVRGADGMVTEVPAHMEDKIAARSAARPYSGARRSTTFWFDKHGVQWKKEVHGGWQRVESVAPDAPLRSREEING